MPQLLSQSGSTCQQSYVCLVSSTMPLIHCCRCTLTQMGNSYISVTPNSITHTALLYYVYGVYCVLSRLSCLMDCADYLYELNCCGRCTTLNLNHRGGYTMRLTFVKSKHFQYNGTVITTICQNRFKNWNSRKSKSDPKGLFSLQERFPSTRNLLSNLMCVAVFPQEEPGSKFSSGVFVLLPQMSGQGGYYFLKVQELSGW